MKNFLPILFFALALIGAVTVVNTVHRVTHRIERTLTVEPLR